MAGGRDFPRRFSAHSSASAPNREDGTLSFRVYRELIAGEFTGLIVEFAEIDHELLVSV